MASFWKVGHRLTTFCCILTISTANYQHKTSVQSNHLYCCFIPPPERQCSVTPQQQQQQIDCPEPLLQVDCTPLKQPQLHSQQIDCLPLQISCFDPCAEDRPSGDTFGFRYTPIQEKNTQYGNDRPVTTIQNTGPPPNIFQDAQLTPSSLNNKLAGAPQNINNRLKPYYKTIPQQLDQEVQRLTPYETGLGPPQYQQQPQSINTMGNRVHYTDDQFQPALSSDPRQYPDDQQMPSSFRTVGANGQMAPPSKKRPAMSPRHNIRQKVSPYSSQRPPSPVEDLWGKSPHLRSRYPYYMQQPETAEYDDAQRRPYKAAVSPYLDQENQPYLYEDKRPTSYNPFATPTLYADQELELYNPAVQQLPPSAYQTDRYPAEFSFGLQKGNLPRGPSPGSHSIPKETDLQTIDVELSSSPKMSLHTPSRNSRHSALSLTSPKDNSLPDSLLSMLPSIKAPVPSDPSEKSDTPYSNCERSPFGPKVLLSCFSLLDPFDIPLRVLNETSSSLKSSAPPALEVPAAKPPANKPKPEVKTGKKSSVII